MERFYTHRKIYHVFHNNEVRNEINVFQLKIFFLVIVRETGDAL